MSTQLKLRRGTTAQHSTFTGAEGEITVDTTKDTVVVHDGSTAGGVPLAKESGSALSPTSVTLSSGTANGVAYLNGSKVLTTGSALTFDGTNLRMGSGTAGTLSSAIRIGNSGTGGGTVTSTLSLGSYGTGYGANIIASANYDSSTSTYLAFGTTPAGATGGAAPTEQMRLTSTGLGIGTSSPGRRLDVAGNGRVTGGNGIFFEWNNGTDATYVSQEVSAEFRINQSTASANSKITFLTQGTLRATLDSSGNLGLGVTPSAWGSGKGFEFGFNGNAVWSYSQTDSYFTHNAKFTDSWRYAATAAASTYRQSAGAHYWNIAPSGTAGNAISFTQAMTLDANGNLGIGTTSPANKLTVNGDIGSNKFAFYNEGAGSAWSTSGYVRFVNGSTENMRIDSSGNVGIGITTPGAKLNVNAVASGLGQALFFFNGTSVNYTDVDTNIFRSAAGAERMRIDSSGNLLVGTTTFNGTNNGVQVASVGLIYVGRPAASTALAFYNTSAGTNVGNIVINSTSTTYATSSDYRLKENVQPMQNALDVVAQLNPVRYTWKADGSDGQGFIAHELQAVVPDCVTGEKDAVDAEGKPVYQGIDTSFLVATLTKAIQEQQEQINQLKAEVATLKGN